MQVGARGHFEQWCLQGLSLEEMHTTLLAESSNQGMAPSATKCAAWKMMECCVHWEKGMCS
eukprot:scaffold29621_cov16-Tisochrysis_lutea.AAC.1